MLCYKDLVAYFGTPLGNGEFFIFLKNNFEDLGEYDVFSRYITCQQTGVDIGFTDNEGIVDDDGEIVIKEGNPVFSHFNIYPKAEAIFNGLPFTIAFDDNRKDVLVKAGNPSVTKAGELKMLRKSFLIDHYKVDDIVISFDYDPVNNSLNLIQVRHNNLVAHLSI